MKEKDRISYIFETLKNMFPDSTTELVYTTPFQLLIAVILSAQTTDKQVNKVTKSLFRKIKQPSDVLDMGEENLRTAISSIGLYTSKAKHIFLLSQRMLDPEYISVCKASASGEVLAVYHTYGYWISDRIDVLQTLAGVGEKTAKVVAHVLYNAPVIAVDTHVHRVTNRLGLVSTKNASQTSKLLETVVPDIYKHVAHHTLILFGRYHCTAKKPNCQSCPLLSLCVYGKRILRHSHT